MKQQSASPSDPGMSRAESRTGMASLRTQLALDRTTLAWIRTTLTMATFGFGTVGFFRALEQKSPSPEAIRLHQAAIEFGVGLVVLAIAGTVFSGVSHWFSLRRLKRGEPPVLSQWPASITLAMLLSVFGLVGLYLLLGR